jgi:hypothetical protein
MAFKAEDTGVDGVMASDNLNGTTVDGGVAVAGCVNADRPLFNSKLIILVESGLLTELGTAEK